MTIEFQELGDALMWQAIYEKFKHRMNPLIMPSMTAIDWLKTNLGFGDFATTITNINGPQT